MYLQLEVNYYSNGANKNKYKNVQLIASTKNNLKIATNCTATTTCNTCCLDFKVLSCLDLILLESIFIELESILLLESYVCFSKIYAALYQYNICK